MMVSHRYRCVFAHVPKCAGTSVRRLFDLQPVTPPYWHCSWEEAEAALGRETLISYFKFTIVRNPWDRIVSAWRMFLDKPWCRQDRHYTLPEFIATVTDESIPYRARYANREAQLRWERTVENMRHHALPCLHPYYGVVDSQGNVAMDEVIDFGEIEEGLGRVVERLGLTPRRLPHENTTRHDHYRRYYDNETRAIIEASFAADIREFAFRF
jgi:chondroitin 4-sulfotransferase 11